MTATSMTLRAVVIAAVASLCLAALPRIARAGCRGSGGGSSSGGGGGSHGDFLLSSSHASECQDDSDVVGFRHCRKFAAWGANLNRPVLVIEAGALVRRFPTLLGTQTGSVIHGDESFRYRVVQPTQGRALDTAVLSTMRASVLLPYNLYGGVEVDLGGLTQTGGASTEMMSSGVFGSPALEQDRGLIVDTLGVVGVRGATGFGGLGVELAGGLRTVSYSFRSDYHNCVGSTSVTAFGAAAEARARGELWLGPWLTAGVMVGASVLERGAWSGGFYLGVHTRAFAGER